MSGSESFYWNRSNRRASSIGFHLFWSGSTPVLRLRYLADGQGVDVQYLLTHTRLNKGGIRWWFICPLKVDGVSCQRRVGKLYLPPGYKYFGCRHCYDLSYESRQEYDKRIANIRPNQIEVIRQLAESLPIAEQFRWHNLLVRASMRWVRHFSHLGKRIGEPSETVIHTRE